MLHLQRHRQKVLKRKLGVARQLWPRSLRKALGPAGAVRALKAQLEEQGASD